ncbi:hypothetical protein ACP4OV_001119 [Aristida adscensionis]
MAECRFERVHFKCLPKLVALSFEYWISEQDPLSFGYVPLLLFQSVSLSHIYLSWHKMLKLSELHNNAKINALQLNFKSEKVNLD